VVYVPRDAFVALAYPGLSSCTPLELLSGGIGHCVAMWEISRGFQPTELVFAFAKRVAARQRIIAGTGTIVGRTSRPVSLRDNVVGGAFDSVG
jgi:hypothetical protein